MDRPVVSLTSALGALVTVLAIAYAPLARAGADQPLYGPPPAWVKPVPIPAAVPGGGAVQFLLEEGQYRFDHGGVTGYSELAVKVLSPEGMAVVGNLARNWNPDTDVLTINKAEVIRDGKVRDLLADGKKFTVIRRERSLEMAMLDGTLTATLQPDDVRVGDIVVWAFTLQHRDPVLGDRADGLDALVGIGPIARGYLRALWPAGTPMRWRTADWLGKPAIGQIGDERELVVDLRETTPPKPPAMAPARYNEAGLFQVTDFADWAQVSALLAPLYTTATTLAPTSPLRRTAAQIAAASADPKARALAALQLVEDQTRYLFLGMNFGGYTPASADLTWSRRFGDCKGKTALLVALLRQLGVKAEPALVSTTVGDGLDQRLPALSWFDHVIVRAEIGGKTYWLDPTRSSDTDLDAIPVPDYHWALPIEAAGTRLEKLAPAPFSEPQAQTLVTIDLSAGVDKPAAVHVEEIKRGDAAIYARLAAHTLPKADADRFMRQLLTERYSWVAPTAVAFREDQAAGTFTYVLDGAGQLPWDKEGLARDFRIDESSIGYDVSYRREPGPDLNAPYLVDFPEFTSAKVTIKLPDGGAGFGFYGADDVQTTLAGVAYFRRSKLAGGLATVEVSRQAIEPEFPAAEADKDAAALREMAADDMMLAAPLSPAPQLTIAKPAERPVPTDAADFTARGADYLRARQYELAIADFDKAVKLEPKVAKRLYNAGVARFEAGQNTAAMANFNAALRLDPADKLALMARGELELLTDGEAAAGADFDQAAKLAPGDPAVLAQRAVAYDRAGRYQAAAGYYDLWIRLYPKDRSLPLVLGRRCLSQAKWGVDLSTSLADCDAAVAAEGANLDALLGRGAIALRLGKVDTALADYTAAQKLAPANASAAWGKGLAERRRGLDSQAASDLLAGRTLDPQIASAFAKLGLGS